MNADRVALAKARATARAHVDGVRAQNSLIDWIPRFSPRFMAPRHLAPVAELFERAKREQVLAVISAPPRHAKTELLMHGIAKLLQEDPSKQCGFCSYGAEFAEKKSDRIRTIARRAGVPISPNSHAKANWRTGVEEGGLWATGVGGPLTGEGFHFLGIDDHTKNRAEAESRLKRDALYDWLNDVAFTRLEPNGSCFVSAARWHTDDLSGRLIKDGWEHVCLPAINDAGEALWPERWSVEALRKIEAKLGPYGWASLYLGAPRPRGGRLFEDAWFYEGAGFESGFRLALGADFAYTAKKRADYSVLVLMAERDGEYFLLDVVRRQVEAPEFLKVCLEAQARWGVPVTTYVAGVERGVVSFMEDGGLRVDARAASADKFVRAQPVAAAWNAGKVLSPAGAPWVNEFLAEVCDFTGVKDLHDDQVDALAAAFDALASDAVAEVTVRGIGVATA